MGFAFLAEDQANRILRFISILRVMEYIFGVTVLFENNFQGPVFEHQPQQLAVMFAAALAVAEDHQAAARVGAQ